MTNYVVLLTSLSGKLLERLKAAFSCIPDVRVVSTLRELNALSLGPDTLLVSFGTGVIVPRAIIEKLGRPAYNLHPASPEFPGRDPHHHAIYREATTYGATLHIMAVEVDAGPIVAMEQFPVPSGATPRSLLAAATEAGLRTIEKCSERLIKVEPMAPLPRVKWGPLKTKRADLIKLSRISPLIAQEEFRRRFRAFDGGEYDNLVVQIHGHSFRIDKSARASTVSAPYQNKFTERAFSELLRQLKDAGYQFAGYKDAIDGHHVLWRHDVDISMHRAEVISEIEARERVTATYFINPHSTFYNLFEPEISDLVKRIIARGHQIGLHFDAAAYAVDEWDLESLERCVAREREILRFCVDAPIESLSWHNPSLTNLLNFENEEIAGLKNAYSRRLRNEYTYCSDSNGYWRFQPMAAVIAEGRPRLHLLTHPEWWMEEELSPSDRVDRAILGRARWVRREYDAALRKSGRHNVTD